MRSIREATRSDRDVVIALWEACGLTRPWNDPRSDFGRAAGGPSSSVLVAEDTDGTAGPLVIGTAMVGHDGHRGWVYYLAVRPGLQGRGHGLALMRACEAWLRERRIPKIQLMVRETNEQVLGFYAAIGYERQAVQVLGRWLEDEDPPQAT
jgi:ribosomal protein S18 acetylase RimI-like enzyme